MGTAFAKSSADYAPALAAAQAACGAQDWPPGVLYVVATPIGNLADVTLRALHLLSIADAVACEDTRHSRQMLRAWGIEPRRLLAVHEHNEAEAAAQVLALLAGGSRVAYVSDAGTPAVSDPGARLAAACRAAGYRVAPLPGASSVTCALSAAGLAEGDGRFVFAGFLPAHAKERAAAVQQLAGEPRAVVLFEAPHRIAALAGALAPLGERTVTLCRELTKQFESIATMPASALAGWLAEDAQRQKGEFVLVLHAARAAAAQRTQAGERTLRLLLEEGLPLAAAARLAARISGAPRSALYATALRWREEGETAGDVSRET